MFKEAKGSEEDLQTWFLLEESENEQLLEVVSRREKSKDQENQSSIPVERGGQSQLEIKGDH